MRMIRHDYTEYSMESDCEMMSQYCLLNGPLNYWGIPEV